MVQAPFLAFFQFLLTAAVVLALAWLGYRLLRSARAHTGPGRRLVAVAAALALAALGGPAVGFGVLVLIGAFWHPGLYAEGAALFGLLVGVVAAVAGAVAIFGLVLWRLLRRPAVPNGPGPS